MFILWFGLHLKLCYAALQDIRQTNTVAAISETSEALCHASQYACFMKHSIRYV